MQKRQIFLLMVPLAYIGPIETSDIKTETFSSPFKNFLQLLQTVDSSLLFNWQMCGNVANFTIL